MVNDIMRRVDRMQLAKAILREELKQAGAESRFTPADITRAARIYLAITRHNTGRLRAKLERLSSVKV